MTNQSNIRFEVEPQEMWNARTNEPFHGYAVVRWSGGAGWTMGKFGTWEAANKIREQLEQNLEHELAMGWDLH